MATDMATRTTQETATVRHPSGSSGADGEHPAGADAVRIEEESIGSLSFPACRRTETSISIPVRPDPTRSDPFRRTRASANSASHGTAPAS